MALKAIKLKQIPQRNKDLAFRNLREKELENRSNYPQLIKYLILFYPNQQDQFDSNATHQSLNFWELCYSKKGNTDLLEAW